MIVLRKRQERYQKPTPNVKMTGINYRKHGKLLKTYYEYFI